MPAAKTPVPLLGRLAIHMQMISMEQLTEALRVRGQAGEERKLGDVMLDLGFISQAQLAELVAAQRRVIAKHKEKKLGESASGTAPEPRPAAAAPRPPAAAPPPEPAPLLLDEDDEDEGPSLFEGRGPASLATEVSPPFGEEGSALFGADAEAPPSLEVSAPSGNAGSGLDAALDVALSDAVARGASDLHLRSGQSPQLRIAGRLVAPEGPVPSAEAVEAMLLGALDAETRSEFEKSGEIDFCYTVEGLGRFRANVYREQRGIDGVFRHIPTTALSIEQLGLPRTVAKLTNYHQGLVLVTGPTGCGKTSTLASLVDLINEERTEHILTIEDPIEYLHPSKRCMVNQRSVKRHTRSFGRALRAALREDPDVIVIGELRDLETISLALTAAETGHLVMATMHTEDSMRTINRVVGAYPADQQEQVRTMLSESLRAVLSQRLLARADGKGRVAALETLIVTKAVANLIRENKVFQIQSILQTGQRQGMQLLERSIDELVAAGTVTEEEANLHRPPSTKRAA
jgi:twitching motility protein PilT